MKRILFQIKRGMSYAVAATLALTLGGMASACGNAASQEMDIDLSAFAVPAGFVWEGDYMDTTSGTDTLTIERSGRKYACIINTSDSGMTHLDSYTFIATMGSTGLEYEEGVHTVYDLPDYEKDPEAAIGYEDVYTDGTGSIYYLDGNLYWIDDVENAGAGMVFEKVEEVEEEVAGETTAEDIAAEESAIEENTAEENTTEETTAVESATEDEESISDEAQQED